LRDDDVVDIRARIGRLADAILARSLAIEWAFVRRWTAWLVPAGFVVMTIEVISKYVQTPAWLGFDARLYAAATAAWVGGSNPWAVNDLGIYFAAPPPTLLAFLPFNWMPPAVVSLLWVLGSLAFAGLAIRSLRLPVWWMLFPPLVDAILVGNPDAVLVPLLVVAGGRLGVFAPFFKIYALIPMIGMQLWRQVGVACALLAATALVLPWATWFAEFPVITANLASTAARQTTSVFGSPILMAIAVVALLALGLRRAGWLAVPLLWPSTQIHYMSLAIPGLTPYLALAWCIPVPEVRLASTCAFALVEWLARRSGESSSDVPLGDAQVDLTSTQQASQAQG
jgi:hypothetical protein